ncbi:DNA adenine methylase [Pelistega sp. MC2]|uniref:DNA adenine methylase n=1 Tax=Pelistega sp. MC2 TaxID=1720297 RepID=UPI0008DADCC4|nr:DNA adenine methylase [Pelistega sp. MC2]
MNSTIKEAKPFLKWAGGKTQLISEIAKLIPQSLTEKPFTFIEPFVGSGAVLFWIINNFSNLKKAIINDINTDLTNVYEVIKHTPLPLIESLQKHQDSFILLEKTESKKEYYYAQRERYNSRQEDAIEHAALFIFLNKTCFNGLYRVNRNNGFNVPMGDYRNPTICDRDNLLAVHNALQKVEILNGSYVDTLSRIDDKNNLFYLDPPYKPLSTTSSFNAYAKDEFDDNAQIRLANFCHKLNSLGHLWILSNSDPKNSDSENNFFDDLYSNYHIQRVEATRAINSKASKRGKLNELLITNQIMETME